MTSHHAVFRWPGAVFVFTVMSLDIFTPVGDISRGLECQAVNGRELPGTGVRCVPLCIHSCHSFMSIQISCQTRTRYKQAPWLPSGSPGPSRGTDVNGDSAKSWCMSVPTPLCLRLHGQCARRPASSQVTCKPETPSRPAVSSESPYLSSAAAVCQVGPRGWVLRPLTWPFSFLTQNFHWTAGVDPCVLTVCAGNWWMLGVVSFLGV